MAHKGIYKRPDFLPHWDFENSVQAITFRLADSLPAHVIQSWKDELQSSLQSLDPTLSQKARTDLHLRIARYEDAGHGSCHLAEPEIADIVQKSLISGHGNTYRIIAWCIMPNHVHALIRLLDDTPLASIVQKWKGSTAIQINRLLNRTGPFWMTDYHDRFIRDHDHLHNAITYIRNNPVKARLCEKPSDWLYSSAGQNWTPDFSPSLPTPRPD